MKTRKLPSMLIALMFITTTVQATGTETSAFSLRAQLAKKILCPSFILEKIYPETVFIRFHVQNDFSVVVEEIASDDERLKQYVEKMLAKQKMYIDKENVGKSYSIKMTFKG